VTSPARVDIRDDSDVAMARKAARALAERAGLSAGAAEALATAVSEVARNIVVHAGSGELVLDLEVDAAGRTAVCVLACDDGPGIEDLERALADGYSTGQGLGLGLPSARRLMDELSLSSPPGQGTLVTMKKYAR
jgi:serine/threonine-protein kinase RsbT